MDSRMSTPVGFNSRENSYSTLRRMSRVTGDLDGIIPHDIILTLMA